MARFLQFQISKGAADGEPLLSASLVETMQRATGIIQTDPNVYYGMGIYIDKRSPERVEHILHHDGWGFGFMSFMHWYPEYGIGAVTLTNRLPTPVLGELALSLTDKLVKDKILTKCHPQAEPVSPQRHHRRSCLGRYIRYYGLEGITDHAQEMLGDLVFVELPEVGTELGVGAECAVVESVKAASDVYSPVSGEVVEVNEVLADAPETINQDAYEEGWIFRVRLSNPAEVDALMDADSYAEHCEAEEH